MTAWPFGKEKLTLDERSHLVTLIDREVGACEEQLRLDPHMAPDQRRAIREYTTALSRLRAKVV